MEKSNNDGFVVAKKLETDIISRFCNGVMMTGDVDQFRLMNNWTLKLALAIEHEIISARKICLQRNVLLTNNDFIFELFEITERIGKDGFILCCGPTGEINNMIMLDSHESRKSFPNLQVLSKDDCVAFSLEFRLDTRLDKSIEQWTNFKNLMKPRKSG